MLMVSQSDYMLQEGYIDIMLEFKKFTDFPRGTMYDILQDAYSYDARNKEIWESNWKESDDFCLYYEIVL